MCSPHLVEHLCFLLRREPTVRMAGNLERRCSLSLSKKIKNPSYCIFLLSACFFVFHLRRQYLAFCLFLINNSTNSTYVLFCLDFDTWHNLGHPSHPLSNLATCVTRVHVVGDLWSHHISLRPILQHPTHRASKNIKFRLSWNSTKFDVVARFHETIPTMKSISSSEI